MPTVRYFDLWLCIITTSRNSNVGRMLGPLDSPVMAEFVAQLPLVNAVADRSDGFVWRLTEATEVRPMTTPLS